MHELQPPCSFKLSELLKKKGFDVICNAVYEKSGQLMVTNTPYGLILCNFPNKNSENIALSAPTHSVAKKWIELNYGVYISIIKVRANDNTLGYIWSIFEGDKHPISEKFDSEVKAIEDALLYVLYNFKPQSDEPQ